MSEALKTGIKQGEMPKPYIKDFGDSKREAIQVFSSHGHIKTFYYAGVVINADLTTEEGRNLVAEQIARFNLYFGCDTAIGPAISRWSSPDDGTLIINQDSKELGFYTDCELAYLLLQEERRNIPNSKMLKANDPGGFFAEEVQRVKAVLPVISS